MENRSVFVTVGTTEFDKLVIAATSFDVCKVLRQLGYTSVLVQIGRGQFEPEVRELGDHTPAVHFYRFKDSIADDIAAANLVISHAGAGSVLETLGAGKSPLVVINDELMGNHQVELAKQLQQLKHLHYCTCSTLQQTLKEADFTALQPYTPGDPSVFASHLHSLLTSSPDLSLCPVFLFHWCWVSVLVLLFTWAPAATSLLLSMLLGLAVFILCGKPQEQSVMKS